MAGLINLEVTLDLKRLSGNVAAVPAKVDRLVAGVMLRQGPASEAYMRTTASWQDRTGNARAGLHATYSGGHGTHTLTLAHGVPYGIWLEVRYAGRYAVIRRAVQAGAQDVFRLLDRGMARL